MNNIYEAIQNSNSILIMAHENPDGDAIGSSVAMYHFLNDINKNVTLLLPEVPPVFNFLVDNIDIIDKSLNEYDLAIVLDCSTKERIGQNNNEFSKCMNSIIIDHHMSNTKYGNINHIEGKTSSCCQVLYYLFKSWNVKFTKEIGDALVTGLLTDTCGFANSNVDKNSFAMIYELYETGIDFHSLYNKILSKKSMAQYNLMKLAVSRLEFFENGKIAFSYITKADFEKFGAKLGDHEGLVDIGRNIDGVEVSVFIREDCSYLISLRSNGLVDVSKIAIKLGGGGHIEAAGAKIDKKFEETKNIVISEIKKELSN